MNEKLKNHLDNIFSPYEDLKQVRELKEELYVDLQEKLNDLKNEGYDDADAYNKTIQSIGDISELVESIREKTIEIQKQINMNFSISDLKFSDLKGVKAQQGKFNYSDLKGSDFSQSDLSGSSFKCSNLENADFNGTNLSNANINKSNLKGANLQNANLTKAEIRSSELKGATFQNTILDGTNFKGSDLSGVCFDNQRLVGTNFDSTGLRGTSFKNAELINVSFRTDVKKTVFDGATMDKLTYALLKGYKANLENVKVK
jgi:uncharacterized protein YjbI with pentapeptide repeats